MAVSRSGLEFLQRHGLSAAPYQPAPRLAIKDLLVHFMPVASPPGPLAETTLYINEGDPIPDRGAARPWPRQE